MSCTLYKLYKKQAYTPLNSITKTVRVRVGDMSKILYQDMSHFISQ